MNFDTLYFVFLVFEKPKWLTHNRNPAKATVKAAKNVNYQPHNITTRFELCLSLSENVGISFIAQYNMFLSPSAPSIILNGNIDNKIVYLTSCVLMIILFW